MRRPGYTALGEPVEISRWTSWNGLPQASPHRRRRRRHRQLTSLSGSAAGRSAARLRWRSGRRPPGRSQRRLRRGRVARGRRGDDTSAAALGVTGRGRGGVAPAATSRPGRQRRHGKPAERFHSGAHSAQALDEALLDRERRWVVVNGAGGVTGGLLVQLAAAGRPRDRDREREEGRAHSRLRRVGGARLPRRLACARSRDHRRRRAQASTPPSGRPPLR